MESVTNNYPKKPEVEGNTPIRRFFAKKEELDFSRVREKVEPKGFKGTVGKVLFGENTAIKDLSLALEGNFASFLNKRLIDENIPEATTVAQQADETFKKSVALMNHVMRSDVKDSQLLASLQITASTLLDEIEKIDGVSATLREFFPKETSGKEIGERRFLGTMRMLQQIVKQNEEKDNAIGPSSLNTVIKIVSNCRNRNALETIQLLQSLQQEIDSFTARVNKIIHSAAESGSEALGSAIVGGVIGYNIGKRG